MLGKTSRRPDSPIFRPSPQIRAYFYSGWAFLIPYLLFYLLYAWLEWPANPVGPGQWEVDGGHSSAVSGATSVVPSLLYVYWALHVIHLILAALALGSWWHDQKNSLTVRKSDSPTVQPSSADCLLSTVHRVAPWLLFTLIIAIPGVYLEWPSDPWSHLGRITEWKTHPLVADHSAGYKTFYFFAYSWMGSLLPPHLFTWLNIYYVGVCLLLAWQYYLLGKAVGLDSRWAFLFVIVSALTLGIVTFSFYRYYGLSTSIYAQLGAIALTRIFLEALQHPKFSLRSFLRRPGWNRRPSNRPTFDRPLPDRPPPTVHCSTTDPSIVASPKADLGSPFSDLRTLSAPTAYRLLPTALLLLLFIRYNHIQGLGIAALGVASVSMWRLTEWKRSTLFWIAGGVCIASIVTVLYWPRSTYIDSELRTQGWLTTWYGFNLFTWPSLAADRALQIFGTFGILNLIAGVVLTLKGNISGWLTVGPVILLTLPFVAVPYSSMLAERGLASDIIVFHRLLFAAPAGLAVLALVREFVNSGYRSIIRLPIPHFSAKTPIAACFLLFLGYAVVFTGNHPWYNRVWHVLSVTPSDLEASSLTTAAESAPLKPYLEQHRKLISTNAISNIFHMIFRGFDPYRNRHDMINHSITQSIQNSQAVILSSRRHISKQKHLLMADEELTNEVAWTTLNGYRPEFIIEIDDLRHISTVLQNRSGKLAGVFTAKLIPIDPTNKYGVEATLIQQTGPSAIARLAIAWYDKDRQFLRSDIPSPMGAGNPRGWNNATYSYFGPLGQSAPRRWTTYRRAFGGTAPPMIPLEARFLRIGALLNYESKEEVVQQLAGVRFWLEPQDSLLTDVELPHEQTLLIVTPSYRVLKSPASQAAQLSLHWPANQVSSDLAGGSEILHSAQSAGAISIDSSELCFELPAWVTPPHPVLGD